MNNETKPTTPTQPLPADLVEALRGARHAMVFTGAGVSAESGIPTFRDALTGLWERFDAGDLASPDAFRRDRDLVWGWYEWRRMKGLQATPNAAHQAIAVLEALYPEFTLVTQNVDDLHERAGNTQVVHLHGELKRPRCFACARPHTLPEGIPDEPEGGRRLTPPICAHCGGYIRPGVVWFGERLPEAAIDQAFAAAQACDILLVVGTSGLVMPAAMIPHRAHLAGKPVVEINPAPSGSKDVDWVLAGAAGTWLPAIAQAVSSGRP